MSTRLYPLYTKGAPQLRIFLPNLWLKLVRPHFEQPKNVVQFKCSMEATRLDIKNYLEKIYGLEVISVHTRIALGKTREEPYKGYVIKDDDIKYAYVILPKGETFEFPDVCNEEAQKKELKDHEKSMDEAKKGYTEFVERSRKRPGVPSWFNI